MDEVPICVIIPPVERDQRKIRIINESPFNFPSKILVPISSIALWICAGVLIAIQINLYKTTGYHSGGVNLAPGPGMWTGLAALVTGTMCLLSTVKPTNCTLATAITSCLLSLIFALSLMVEVVYRSVHESDPDNNQGRFSIFKNWFSSDKNEKEFVTIQVDQTVIMVFAIMQLITSSMLLVVLGCAIKRRHVREQVTSMLAGSSVLYSTRTEHQQREGFVTIPVHPGLYRVTGNTLDRTGNDNTNASEPTQERERVDIDPEVNPCSLEVQDLPPKYEDTMMGKTLHL